MLQVKVNDQHSFELETQAGAVTVNGTPIDADIRQLKDNTWHVINDLKSYNVELIEYSRADKTAKIKINNSILSVSAKDQFDILLEKLGMSNASQAKISEVKAPMPGMVLKVFVEEGAAVQRGDNLFVLEAMKMENIIKAPADVIVKSISIKPGDKVEKGQVLIRF